jgi:hypothetical protein
VHPKIAPGQAIPTTGSSIWGPIGPWDPDEATAIFTFVISQIVGNGVAVGIGTSEPYYPSDSQWDGEVTVLPGPGFKRGGATVMAWASIALKDGGWRMYPWGRPVDLA